MVSAVPSLIEITRQQSFRYLPQSTSIISLSRYPKWNIPSIATFKAQLANLPSAPQPQPFAAMLQPLAVQTPTTTLKRLQESSHVTTTLLMVIA